MKRLSVFIALLIFFCATSVHASASELDEYTSKLFDALPPLAQESVGQALREGELASVVSAEYLAEMLVRSFSSGISQSGADFFVLLSFVVFYFALSLFRTNVGEGACRAAECVLLTLASLAIHASFFDGVELACSYVEDVRTFENSLIPITAGLYLMGGNTATAVTASTGAGAALVFIENLSSQVIPTLTRVSFALVMIGTLGSNSGYSAICKSVRNAYMSILGFFTMILSASISFGVTLSSGADSVAARTLKYAIGNIIPIVGGTVNSAYGTLAASVSLIKNTVGVSSIVALIVITVPVVVRLLVIRLSLNLCSVVSELLGCARIGKLYTDFRAVYDIALSGVVFVFVVFLIVISIFLKCAVAIG